MSDRLTEMLDAQRELQEIINGYKLENQDIEQRIANIKENVLALTAELYAEVLGEIGWKSWASSRHINEDAVKKELIDVFHFFMNLMLHAGMTADELYEGYVQKREKNIQRQRDGYDGVSTKCVGCGRALDDVSLLEDQTMSGRGRIWCPCGQPLTEAQLLTYAAD